MKKTAILLMLFALASFRLSAQLYSTNAAFVGFYSKTPLEDVVAEAKNALAVINLASRDLAFSVANMSFNFPNKLMQEHFNEKYMESEKNPNSTFKGRVVEDVDLNKDGEYKITAKGKLNIHGVEQDRVIPGTITVKDGKVTLKSNFKVKGADHQVAIPSIIMEKLAEEMDVKVDATLNPKKK
jgi:polyisoprenoid-binding protein YceI